MSSSIPKLKWFIFISIIGMLINLSACCVALLGSEQTITDYSIFEEEEIKTYDQENEQTTNVSVSNFALAVGTSFIPFISIINLAFLGLDVITSLVLSIITIFFGAVQVIIIYDMIMGHLPFVNIDV